MIFDLSMSTDVTALALQARDERRGREETTVVDHGLPSFEGTTFRSYQSSTPSMRRTGPRTPTVAELGEETGRAQASKVVLSPEHKADRDRDGRLSLLARKYEGQSTTEDDARLAILTARLRKLEPRVSSADLDNLSSMVGQLEQVSSNLEAIRSKFGLK